MKTSLLQQTLQLQRSLHSVLSRPSGQRSTEDILGALASFDRLIGRLYELRATTPLHDSGRDQIEDMVAATARDVQTLRPGRAEPKIWLREYRTVWREEWATLFYCAVVFISTGLCGAALAMASPDLAPVLIGPAAMELVLERVEWFRSIQGSPLADGISIAYNNISVAFGCFAASALLGFGGLLLLGYNGLFFGALFGFTVVHGFEEPLTSFVIAHGPLELSVIVAAAFAGLLFGREFFVRPWSDLPARLKAGGRRGSVVILGVVPWLIIAALVESMVSPWDYLPFLGRLIMGIGLALGFWAWTFWPISDSDKRSE